jgi:hypothetical protein
VPTAEIALARHARARAAATPTSPPRPWRVGGLLPALAVAGSVAAGLAGCVDGAGSLALVLQLPPPGDLRPTGMTSISVSTQVTGETANVRTTPLVMNGGALSFAAGDVAAGAPLRLGVELRDVDNRLVGVGEVDAPVTPARTGITTVDVAVRKPLIYVAGAGAVITLDTTRDALDPKYQGTISAATSPQVVVAIDGTELAVFSAGGMTRIGTADHQPKGAALAIPGGAVTDAAAVPGARKVVAATAGGVAIIDVDAATVQMVALPDPPDRIAVGGSVEVGFVAYALSGRAPPPTGAGLCTATPSTVTGIRLDTSVAAPMTNSAPLADLAADDHGLFAADPCHGTVLAFDTTSGHKLLDVAGAAALAINDGRLWIAGSLPPTTGTDASGARITLTSAPTAGGMSQTVMLPPKGEVITYLRDPRREIAINLQADTEVPIGMAVQPGNGAIAILTRMDSHRPAKIDSTFGEIIPDMTATVTDLVLADPQTGGQLHRIRTKCTLTYDGTLSLFDMWACSTVTPSEAPSGGEFTPSAVTALFGGS